MNYETAAELLGQVHYKPQYTLKAEATPPWVSPNGMVVNIEAWLPDSSDHPRYQKRSIAGGMFEINLDLIRESDAVTFLRIVFNNLLKWEEHEAREFFRFGPGWIAPFHPHKEAGRELYEDTAGAQPAEVYAAA